MSAVEKYKPSAAAPAPIILPPEDAKKYAKAFAASQMFSAGYNNATEAQIFSTIMVGAEYGFGPGAAMVNLHVMDGKPELSANAQAAFIKKSGRYDYRVTEHTDKVCEITVISVPSGEIVGVERYTWEDAERQELTNLTKRGNKTNWHKTPRNMLFARCVSNVCAFHCPDVVPMRTYSPGEISGHDGEERPEVTPAQMAQVAAIEARVEEGREPPAVEVVQDADVELEEPPVNDPDPNRPIVTAAEAGAGPDGFDLVNDKGETVVIPIDPSVEAHAQAQADRFSPAAIETRLREDIPKLDQNAKDIIKASVAAADLPWSYPSIVKLIVDSGYTDVHSWLRSEQEKVAGASQEPQEASAPPEGVQGRQTGSQTSPTLSDRQIGMFNARCSDAGFTEPERKAFIRKYAQVESSKDIRKKDFDELLATLKDIAEGTPETKRAYLEG